MGIAPTIGGRSGSTNDLLAAAFGFKVWNANPLGSPSSTSAGASGEMRWTAIAVRGGETYSNVWYWKTGTNAAGLTKARIGIFDSSLALVASTASFHATLNAQADGVYSVALSAAWTPAADGLYYVGLLQVGTTPASIKDLISTTNDLSFGTKKFTGRQTTLTDLPNPAIYAAGNVGYWHALS